MKIFSYNTIMFFLLIITCFLILFSFENIVKEISPSLTGNIISISPYIQKIPIILDILAIFIILFIIIFYFNFKFKSHKNPDLKTEIYLIKKNFV